MVHIVNTSSSPFSIFSAIVNCLRIMKHTITVKNTLLKKFQQALFYLLFVYINNIPLFYNIELSDDTISV